MPLEEMIQIPKRELDCIKDKAQMYKNEIKGAHKNAELQKFYASDTIKTLKCNLTLRIRSLDKAFKESVKYFPTQFVSAEETTLRSEIAAIEKVLM